MSKLKPEAQPPAAGGRTLPPGAPGGTGGKGHKGGNAFLARIEEVAPDSPDSVFQELPSPRPSDAAA